MIRGDKKLVRRLRRAARLAWKKLPRARRRREKKRSGRLRRHRPLASLRLGLSLLIFLLVAVPDFSLAALFGLLALHGVLATLRLAASLAGELRDPERLWLAFLLPTDDRAIFDAQTRPFLRGALFLAGDWLALGLGMAIWREHPGWWVAAPLLALAQGAFAASCALFLARLRPDARWQTTHTLCAWIIGAFLMFGRHLSADALEWGRAALELLRRATPFGLFANGAHLAATKHAVLFAWLAVVALATLGLAWRLRHRWRAAYSTAFLQDMIDAPAPAGLAPPDELPIELATPSNLAATARVVAEPRPERSVAFDNPHDRRIIARELRLRLDYDPGEAYASQGPMERVFALLWSARQRRLLAIYGPPPSRWHRRLGAALLIVVVGGLVASAGGKNTAALIGSGIGFALLLPVWETRWGALWTLNNGAARSPIHGYLPISLASLAGAYWSQAHAKILIAGAMLFGGLVPWLGAGEALHYGALGCCLAMSWAPLSILFGISAGTNDSSARWWHPVLLLAFGGAFLVGGMTLLVTAFSVADPRMMAVCAALAIVTTNALLLGYVWIAGRRRFDLMPLVRR